ncbi:MAG: CCA tRNA nucleotidyltransferase [Candidatus Micrarchaeia archaeon]
MPRKIDALLDSVAREITPSPEEVVREKAFAAQIAKSISAALKDPEAAIRFVGSAARDTGLRGDADIDLFIQFPRRHDEDYIVKKAFDAARAAVQAEWVMHYAEHPYLQARVEGFTVEVIPCFHYEANTELKSAVDRSPLHMTYLQEKLSRLQRRDVRLLKQFLKNAGLYGAEISIQGFSGVLCEYLILNYRSFDNLVAQAAKWKPPVFVDIEGFYLSSKPEFGSPLVLIDAIDRNRNVAAVVSETNFHRFVSLCQAFVRAPDRKLFFRPKPAPAKPEQVKKRLKERGTSFLLAAFEKPNLVEDILDPQLKKTRLALVRHLELAGFTVVDSMHYTAGRCGILCEFASFTRPRVNVLQGPPASDEQSVLRFAKAHPRALRGPYVKGDRVYAEEPAAFTDARLLCLKLIKRPEDFGAASFVSKPLKSATLLEDEEIARLPADELAAIAAYLGKREPWLS